MKDTNFIFEWHPNTYTHELKQFLGCKSYMYFAPRHKGKCYGLLLAGLFVYALSLHAFGSRHFSITRVSQTDVSYQSRWYD